MAKVLMIRTSFFLPATLHQRLLMLSGYERKSLSDLVRELLEKALVSREQARIARTYQALEKLEGICKDNIPDASSTINQTLYGEHGAWRPQAE
jgi:predicted DNA-binding protein